MLLLFGKESTLLAMLLILLLPEWNQRLFSWLEMVVMMVRLMLLTCQCAYKVFWYVCRWLKLLHRRRILLLMLLSSELRSWRCCVNKVGRRTRVVLVLCRQTKVFDWRHVLLVLMWRSDWTRRASWTLYWSWIVRGGCWQEWSLGQICTCCRRFRRRHSIRRRLIKWWSWRANSE